MSQTSERLYPLLPSFHRQSDLAAGEPLRALLAVLERELKLVESDIDQLYENWFIETCEYWVVPYIAELLGVRRLPAAGSLEYNQRTYIANTLSYRRRKGTSSLIAQLPQDLADWPVRIVEFFRLVATTQHLLLTPRAGTLDLRDRTALRRLGGAFDSVPHVAEVRNIPSHSGRYNLPNIGVFLWRLRSYRVPLTSAKILDAATGKCTFDPLGRDVPLFNPDRTVLGTEPQEYDVPGPLGRGMLSEDLDAHRLDASKPLRYFGADPVVQIRYNGATLPIDWEKLIIADLSTWTASFDGDGDHIVAIDPQRGRLLFSPVLLDELADDMESLDSVKVSYSYGFSGEIGGGPYARLDPQTTPPAEFTVRKSDTTRDTLLKALTAVETRWTGGNHTNPVVVQIEDSEVYALTEKITARAGMQLVIRAADQHRPVFVLADSTAPTSGMLPDNSGIYLENGASVTLDGLTLGSGILRVRAGVSSSLVLRHSTLLPTADDTAGKWPSVQVVASSGTFTLDVSRSITGPLVLPKPGGVLICTDSIIDGAGTTEVTLDGDTATIERCTVFGRTTVNNMPLASDSIFMDVVRVVRTQPGCMRFCYVPGAETGDSPTLFSNTPARYRCQPDSALIGVQSTPARRDVRTRLVPRFTATLCGQPGYAQLSTRCSEQIRRGGSDESEMGAFFHLHQPQREANLRASLQEYLRFGYEAGIFFLT